jgi:hypothetical protein
MGFAMRLVMMGARTPEQGAQTLVWLATAPGHDLASGAYYVDMKRRAPSPDGEDRDAPKRLWEVSEAQCARSV